MSTKGNSSLKYHLSQIHQISDPSRREEEEEERESLGPAASSTSGTVETVPKTQLPLQACGIRPGNS